MQNTRLQTATKEQSDDPADGPRVVVLYQDRATRARAMAAWDRVAAAASLEDIRTTAWRASDLKRPGVFLDAIRAAGEADVVLVSLWADGRDLPQLETWAEAWLPLRRQRPGALAALLSSLPGAGREPSIVEQYLQGVARRSGMDFIGEEHSLPPATSAPVSAESIAGKTSAGAKAMTHLKRPQPPEHWGINE